MLCFQYVMIWCLYIYEPERLKLPLHVLRVGGAANLVNNLLQGFQCRDGGEAGRVLRHDHLYLQRIHLHSHEFTYCNDPHSAARGWSQSNTKNHLQWNFKIWIVKFYKNYRWVCGQKNCSKVLSFPYRWHLLFNISAHKGLICFIEEWCKEKKHFVTKNFLFIHSVQEAYRNSELYLSILWGCKKKSVSWRSENYLWQKIEIFSLLFNLMHFPSDINAECKCILRHNPRKFIFRKH